MLREHTRWFGWTALALLAWAPAAPAGDVPRIEVRMIESQGSGLDAVLLDALTEVLGQALAKGGRMEVVPRGAPPAKAWAAYRVTTVVSKIGSECILDLQVASLPDGLITASTSERGPCDEETIAQQLGMAADGLAAGLLAFQGAGSERARARPALEVVMIESRGAQLPAEEIVSLTGFLRTRLSEEGVFTVLSGTSTGREPRAAERGAGYTLSPWVGKVGSQCVVSADLLDSTSNLLVQSALLRTECAADAITTAFERLAHELSAGFGRTRPQVAEGRRRLAVLLPESRGSPLSADEVSSLGLYVRSRLLSAVQVECLTAPAPRLKPGESGVDLSLSTSISKVGKQCLISGSVWDLARATQVGAITVRAPCEPDALVLGVEEYAQKVAHFLSRP